MICFLPPFPFSFVPFSSSHLVAGVAADNTEVDLMQRFSVEIVKSEGISTSAHGHARDHQQGCYYAQHAHCGEKLGR